MKDSFYTPPNLAERLLKFVRKKKLRTVVDFCVGDGELLKAAVNKWPIIECFGTDISQKALSSIKSLHPNWRMGKCDFLNKASRKRCKVLKKVVDGFDLILLNPPFSCIGGSVHRIELEGKIFDASTSMAFLVESIKYLSKAGCIYAILPNGVAYSQKDNELWKILVENYKLTVLEESNEKHFEDCSSRIILISINANSPLCVSWKLKPLSFYTDGFTVFRGRVSMHTFDDKSKDGKFLIHSTNLRNNRIENLKYKVQREQSEVSGPAVLIPRVGLPNINKICTISRDKTFVLSDCVIAILTKTQKEADGLKGIIIKNWKYVREMYKGTGAKYITIERLEQFLRLR